MSDRRLDRLAKALTGRERAILALHSYKSGAAWKPPQVRLSSFETAEYNRLVDIMNFANGEVADIILLLGEQVTQEELRLIVLRLLRARAQERYAVKLYLDECVPQPVTESEAAKRKKAPPAGWQVLPDADADEVALLLDDRRTLERLVSRGAFIDLPLDLQDLPEEPETAEDEVRLVAKAVQCGLESIWVQLCACEELLTEYAREFNGEDVLIPKMRERADETGSEIMVLVEEFRRYAGAWELPKDHSDATALLRQAEQRVLSR